MPFYVTLYKLTDQGIKNIKGSPKRIEEGIRSLETMGGKVHGFYALLGEYDYISIAEAPNDEIGMIFNIGLSSQGNVRTTTLKAFTTAEFTEMVKKLT